ncbi:MAG: hemolysin family protein [Methylophilaceae bacterium]
MSNHLFLIVIAFLLVILNGFFVAAEFALVKLRQTRVKAISKVYGFRGKILAKVHSQLDAYLSACQLGITLASLGLGWVGEPAFAALLEPLFAYVGVHSLELINGISFVVAFFTISYLHIVLGELAPKSFSIREPEFVSVWTCVPLYLFYWAMYPAIWVLNNSANFVLKTLGLGEASHHDAYYSADELKLILKSSRASDNLSRDEWNILAHTLDFSDLEVSDLMRPINEAVVLNVQNSDEDNLKIITQYRFSRYPYVDEGGNVIGIIHLKDIFLAKLSDSTKLGLGELVRPYQHVLPDMPAMELFRRFRKGAVHFAIVGYRGQPPIGFLTLDNMLGALVGEIRDEFLQSQNDWSKLDDGTLLGKGSLPIFTLERALGLVIDIDEVDSVGGLVMWKLGDLPKVGDKIAFDQFDIVVKKMKGPRIVLLRVYPHVMH